MLAAAGLPAPAREHPLGRSIGRRWRLDLAWPDQRVAVEIDGGAILHRQVRGRRVMIPGRHNTEAGRAADATRDAFAALDGWLVFRVGRVVLASGAWVRWVALALAQRGPNPLAPLAWVALGVERRVAFGAGGTLAPDASMFPTPGGARPPSRRRP